MRPPPDNSQPTTRLGESVDADLSVYSGAQRWRRPVVVSTGFLLVAAFSLWLRSGFPAFAHGYAGHDDFLFVRLALSLGAGQWLGPYDNLILAKGMFYPFFILSSYVSGLPLKLAELLVYLAAAGVCSVTVAKIARSWPLGFVLFLVLSLNPVFWHSSLARIIREGLYIGLALGVFALVSRLFAPEPDAARARIADKVALGLLTGALAGAFWLTREEGVWILPALATVAAAGLMSALVPARGPTVRVALGYLVAKLPAASLAVLVVLAAVLTVAAINWKHYGVFTDVEFKAKGFVAGYGALSRIPHEHWQRYVLFPRDARDKAYAVSPAVAELRPALDGPIGDGWRAVGCEQQAVRPCPEILAGWFMWALRDAVAAAGHYRTGAAAEAFYQRLTQEIDDACTSGRLVGCLPRRDTLQPPIQSSYLRDTLAMIPQMGSVLLRFGEGQVGSGASVGPVDGLALVQALVGPIVPRQQLTGPIRLNGWMATRGNAPSVALQDDSGTIAGSISLAPAPDIESDVTRRGLTVRYFDAQSVCEQARCSLVVTTDAGARRIRLDALNGGTRTDEPDLVLVVDQVRRAGELGMADTLASRREKLIARVASAIASIYVVLTPWLFATGLLGLIASVFQWRRDRERLFLAGVGLAAAITVASRVALLSYLEVTTIPALNLLYLSPATPFVIIVVVLGNWMGAGLVAQKAGLAREVALS